MSVAASTASDIVGHVAGNQVGVTRPEAELLIANAELYAAGRNVASLLVWMDVLRDTGTRGDPDLNEGQPVARGEGAPDDARKRIDSLQLLVAARAGFGH